MQKDFHSQVWQLVFLLGWVTVSLAECSCSSASNTLGGAQVQARSADFHLADINGAPVSLSSLRGQVVIVDFWATWCAPCRDAFAFYRGLLQRHPDLVVVAVSVDESLDSVKEYVSREQLPFTVLWDQKQQVVADFRPPTMPSAYVIDREGQMIYRHVGFKPADAAEFEAKLVKVMQP